MPFHAAEAGVSFGHSGGDPRRLQHTHTQDSLLSPTYVSMSQWERLAVQGTYTEDVVEGLEKVTCMSAASFGPVQTGRVLRPPG